MKNGLKLLFLVSLIVFSIPSQAQDSCDSILKMWIHDKYTSYQEGVSNQSFHSALCDSYSQTSGGGVGVSYAGIGFSVDQVSAYGKRLCSSDSSGRSEYGISNVEKNMVNQGIVASWERCIELKTKSTGLQFSVNSFNDKNITIVVHHNPPFAGASADFQGVQVRPEGAFKCKGINPETRINLSFDDDTLFTLPQRKNINISCDRLTNQDSRIMVLTSQGNWSIPFSDSTPQKGSPAHVEVLRVGSFIALEGPYNLEIARTACNDYTGPKGETYKNISIKKDFTKLSRDYDLIGLIQKGGRQEFWQFSAQYRRVKRLVHTDENVKNLVCVDVAYVEPKYINGRPVGVN